MIIKLTTLKVKFFIRDALRDIAPVLSLKIKKIYHDQSF